MATATYDIKVLKKSARSIEIEVRSTQDEAVSLWPSLALRVLHKSPGSPLEYENLYAQETFDKRFAEAIEHVELLKRKTSAATWRVNVKNERFIAHLKKGAMWESYDYPTDDDSWIDAAFAADGALVLVGNRTGFAEVLPLKKKALGAAKTWLNHPGLCAVAAGREVLVTAGGSSLRTWTLDGTQTHEISVGAVVTCIALSADGTEIAFGDAGGGVARWKISSKPQAAIATGPGPISAITFARKGEIVAGFHDGSARRYARSGEILETSPAHAGPTKGLALGPSGDLLTIGADKKVIRSDKGKLEQTIEHTRPREYWYAYADLVDHGTAFICMDGPEIWRIDASAGARSLLANTDASWLSALASNHLLVGCEGGGASKESIVRVHRRDGSLLHRLKLPAAGSGGSISDTALRISPDERWIAVPHLRDAEIAGDMGRVELHAVESGEVVVLPNPSVHGWTDAVQAVTWLGSNVLVAYAQHNAILWSTAGKRVATLKPILSAHAASGRLVASHVKPAALTVYDEALAKGHSLALKGQLESAWVEAISGGGHHAILRGDGKVLLWSLDTNDVWPVPAPEGGGDARSMVVTFGGSEHDLFVASEKKDVGVRVYDVRSKSVIADVPRAEPTKRVIVAPDSTFWITSERALDHHDRTGKQLARFEAPSTIETLEIVSAFFTAKGQIVTATREDDVVRTWSTDGGSGAPLRWLGRKRVKLIPSADRTMAVGLGAYDVTIVTL